ncbi:MAG: hypothetical protein V3T31_03115 [candidate division Zixibacteria bacterium]
MSALEEVLARRIWSVPGFMVYGLPGVGEIGMLVAETIGSETAIHYATADITGQTQLVQFADLVDHRGNSLPATIDTPRLFIRPRSEWSAFVIGEESDESFRIARHPDAPGPVTCDLIVMEIGS